MTKEKTKINDEISIVLLGPDGKVKNEKGTLKERFQKLVKEIFS